MIQRSAFGVRRSALTAIPVPCCLAHLRCTDLLLIHETPNAERRTPNSPVFRFNEGIPQ